MGVLRSKGASGRAGMPAGGHPAQSNNPALVRDGRSQTGSAHRMPVSSAHLFQTKRQAESFQAAALRKPGTTFHNAITASLKNIRVQRRAKPRLYYRLRVALFVQVRKQEIRRQSGVVP